MFIRKKTKKDQLTKKEYYTYQLVESIRTERGPRQKILLSIGVQIELSDQDRKFLAKRIDELISGIQTLIPYPEHIESLAQTFARQLIGKQSIPQKEASSTPDYETVDLNSLSHENARSVGIEHIAWETFKKLGLDKNLAALGLSSRQVEIAAGSIIGRLVHPSSERSTHFWLKNLSSLDELMGTSFGLLSTQKLYQISDTLLHHKNNIEEHLELVEKDLFSLDHTIALYDLTNTYFEGATHQNGKAKRGRSKEKRSDCPLVTLGLVLTPQGFPRKSHIFEGNVSEPKTLQEMIEHLQTPSHKKPVIVLDAGIATKKNLEWLREEQYPYIVSSRKNEEIPSDLEYEIIREQGESIVKASLMKEEDTGELKLICHSTAREKKELSMKHFFQERFEEKLQNLSDGLTKKGCTKSYEKVLEKIGRLKQKYSTVARFYQIEVKQKEKNASSIQWECNVESLKDRYGGNYVLRSFGLDWTAKRLWKTYIMLTKVEEGFRCLKSELGLRPIYHQKESRVDGHLFITLLAYHLMQSVLYELSKNEIHMRWETLKLIMSNHSRVTTKVRNNQGQTIHIRSSTTATPLQQKIYQALNISNCPGRKLKTVV